MEHQHQPEAPQKGNRRSFKMDHGSKSWRLGPFMGMEGHNHHAMMIADLKNGFI